MRTSLRRQYNQGGTSLRLFIQVFKGLFVCVTQNISFHFEISTEILIFAVCLYHNIIVNMKILRQTANKRTSTSELLSQRPTRETGILSALGMTPRKRFAQYLHGNDIDDLQRDARVIAQDMEMVIKVLADGRKRTKRN